MNEVIPDIAQLVARIKTFFESYRHVSTLEQHEYESFSDTPNQAADIEVRITPNKANACPVSISITTVDSEDYIFQLNAGHGLVFESVSGSFTITDLFDCLEAIVDGHVNENVTFYRGEVYSASGHILTENDREDSGIYHLGLRWLIAVIFRRGEKKDFQYDSWL